MSPLSFADFLVRSAVENGVASTVSKARKGKNLEMAMGWAWLNVHERTESDAWRFDESSRDKGGDWVLMHYVLFGMQLKICWCTII